MNIKSNLTKKDKEELFIYYFFSVIFPQIYRFYSELSFIDFEFKRQDLVKIVEILKRVSQTKKKYRLNNLSIIETIEKLNEKKNSDIVIKVDDMDEFFNLLYQIKIESDRKKEFELFTSQNLLTTIWLRMGPEDFKNVNQFLRRQLDFIKNDYYFGKKEKKLKTKGNIDIFYRNQSNQNWFETNNYIEFYMQKISDLPYTERYYFPSIHYGLTKENEKSVVYLYGIQNVNENEKNPEVRKEFQKERKKLRNSETSPDFILALKLFIDLMISKGIETIKVPMLQVYNYDYHTELSKKAKQMKTYTLEEEQELDRKIKLGTENDDVIEYEFVKLFYNRFYNKQDIISKNKTERLISIIQMVEEIYGNIEIINEPMIQGDCLIIKIKKEEDKKVKKIGEKND